MSVKPINDEIAIAATLLKGRKAAEAVARLESVLRSDPDNVAALSLLGEAHWALNCKNAAQSAFERAFAINDQDGDVCSWLGLIAEQRRDIAQAEKHYQRAIDFGTSAWQSYIRLAGIHHHRGQKYEALQILHQGEQRFPNEREITFARGRLAASAAPLWHLPMLADQSRNDAYEAAIEAVVKPGDILLEIGAGSGLLAMMAARAGAGHVYACEENPLIARIASEIITCNGFQDRVTVIAKHSSALTIGGDLPGKADILITEIFDNALIGEGALPTIGHAWRALLKDDATVIPDHATLFGALTASRHLRGFYNAGMINGFDLSAMAILAHPLHYKDAESNFEAAPENKILSTKFTAGAVNFQHAPPPGFTASATATITTDGLADSVLLWFDLHLAPGVVFSTEKTAAHQHWRQVSQILHTPMNVKTGDKIAIETRYDRYFDFAVAKR